jgi:hypothetical protein
LNQILPVGFESIAISNFPPKGVRDHQ